MTLATPTAGQSISSGVWGTALTQLYNDLTGGTFAISGVNPFSPPIAQLQQIVAQTLTNGVGGDITFTSEDWDSSNAHSTVTNTARFTCVYPGKYEFAGGVGFASNATGVRSTLWRKNGSDIAGAQLLWSASSAFASSFPARVIQVSMIAGDYVTMAAIQTSGGNLDTDVSSAVRPSMTVKRVSS